MRRGLEGPEGQEPADQPATARIAFGPFQFDPATGELWRAGQAVPIQPQPGRVLALLLIRAGTLVTRDQLRERLWGSRFVETDLGINYCIRQIRRALSDDPQLPTYIETLRGRGYRFRRSSIHRLEGKRPAGRHRRWLIAGLAAGILASAAVRTSDRDPAPAGSDGSAVLAIAPLSDLTGVAGCAILARMVATNLRNQLSAADPAHLEVIQEPELRQARHRTGKRFMLSGVVREERATRWMTFYIVRASDGRVTWSESLRTAALSSGPLPPALVHRMIRALAAAG